MAASLSQRLADRFDKRLHRGLVVIDAEAESKPPVAAVDVDALRGEAPLHVFGVVDVEGEEVAPRGSGRRHQARGRQARKVEGAQGPSRKRDCRRIAWAWMSATVTPRPASQSMAALKRYRPDGSNVEPQNRNASVE